MKNYYVPRGNVEIIGWVADNILDAEDTLSFILQDLEKQYEAFYWPAFCWPFKVRTKKIESWLRTGNLPSHMDFKTKNGVYYNLIIDHCYCKFKQIVRYPQGHSRAFQYFPVGDPSAVKSYLVDYTVNKEEKLHMLFDSYKGSVHKALDFTVNVQWAIGRIVHESPSDKDVNNSNSLMGENKQDSILVVVPSQAFIKQI